MAKLKTAEKAIVLGGILEKFGYSAEIKHDAVKEKYFVETPDFVFMLGIHGQQDGYTVHVMADASIAIMVMEAVNRSVPGLAAYGPFARDPEAGGKFAQGERALAIKDSLIMIAANEVIKRRLAEQAAPAETAPVTADERGIIIVGG